MSAPFWRSDSPVIRVGGISLAVQVIAAAVGALAIGSTWVAVQWDFPTGEATNILPKWLGLSVLPFVTALLLLAYARTTDLPGWPRILRIGAFAIMLIAQLAIILVNL